MIAFETNDGYTPATDRRGCFAPRAVALSRRAPPTRKRPRPARIDFDAILNATDAGLAYANIHTLTHLGGEYSRTAQAPLIFVASPCTFAMRAARRARRSRRAPGATTRMSAPNPSSH